ncbi:ABC transporter permease [Chloroflexota bacterium]
MGLVRRAVRNLVRSPLRTGGIVAILTVSIGLALIMLTVHGAAQNQLESIRGDIGTEIQVRPAGVFGLMGGGEPLDEADVARINDVPHVVSVQGSVQTRYTGDTLESAIEMGTLGRRFQGQTGEIPEVGPELLVRPDGGVSFRMGITVIGFDPTTADPVLIGGANMTMKDGRYFTIGEADADVLVVGYALAEKNGLTVGSEVDINGVSLEVIGTYTSGQVFGDNILVMPIDTAQRLFELDGATSVTVVTDYVDNVDAVISGIRGIFSQDEADVISSADTYDRINQPLVNAGSASQTGMIAAFLVAAVVILFSVILMVRQRVREIGILKAIGASNWRIGLQFSIETLGMSIAAAVIGALIAFPLAQKVADMLVTSPASPLGPGGMRGPGGLVTRGAFGGGFTSFAGIDIAVSPEIFLYALGMAIALAVVASIFPSWYISRVKPVEVLRNE